ncbi:MAG TPA: STM4012 family radical SAM protein [Pyrinomonadaceae bacterium]|nr:STM4012 family radical SAM protein [Pyrinomonadaceae bacterium]
MRGVERIFSLSPYESYAYSYPHKTAYRMLARPRPLGDVWAGERKDALFLYLHVPFCEMRCGFCNLFTTTDPKADFENVYLDALLRQSQVVGDALGEARFARVALGGGTPTFLSLSALDTLFDGVERIFGPARGVPTSCETSPLTATEEKLRLLRGRGVDRVSIGVQSFIEQEVNAVGRAQKTSVVERALTRIRKVGFPVLNIDLMYGLPHQTVESWLGSLEEALHYEPEELYLYPLYVRPLTGMGRRPKAWDDVRLDCYRAGRDTLLGAGYEQVSMRMFRSAQAPSRAEPVYCCQEDGMVGLGCGARSYTRGLHYSNEYAVGASGVREIIERYAASSDAQFGEACYGFELDEDEERRRFLIKSLLRTEGLCLDAYRERFGADVSADFPELDALSQDGLATSDGRQLRLSERGLELSDAIGPWLYSAAVRRLGESYELR